MITAKVIAASECQHTGQRITTFELEYPRIIHGEFMTHRLFSRNAASTRAVPTPKAVEHVLANPYTPLRWGANKGGMQAGEDLGDQAKAELAEGWTLLRELTCKFVMEFHNLGLHKQWAARPLEVHQIIKVVMTTTELENFFWLRDDEDAQPEIVELARVIRAAMNDANYLILKEGEWHTPYFRNGMWSAAFHEESLDTALAISASCCGQVSYRKLDDSVEKAEDIRGKLINGRRVHASPFEHQATPIGEDAYSEKDVDTGRYLWKNGITHMDREGSFWSGNFQNWIQHRQLIPNHVKV